MYRACFCDPAPCVPSVLRCARGGCVQLFWSRDDDELDATDINARGSNS